MQPVEPVGDRPRVLPAHHQPGPALGAGAVEVGDGLDQAPAAVGRAQDPVPSGDLRAGFGEVGLEMTDGQVDRIDAAGPEVAGPAVAMIDEPVHHERRSEEHTYELQSLMRNSYAGFCLKQ